MIILEGSSPISSAASSVASHPNRFNPQVLQHQHQHHHQQQQFPWNFFASLSLFSAVV
jgi:hypothetical protein